MTAFCWCYWQLSALGLLILLKMLSRQIKLWTSQQNGGEYWQAGPSVHWMVTDEGIHWCSHGCYNCREIVIYLYVQHITLFSRSLTILNVQSLKCLICAEHLHKPNGSNTALTHLKKYFFNYAQRNSRSKWTNIFYTVKLS